VPSTPGGRNPTVAAKGRPSGRPPLWHRDKFADLRALSCQPAIRNPTRDQLGGWLATPSVDADHEKDDQPENRHDEDGLRRDAVEENKQTTGNAVHWDSTDAIRPAGFEPATPEL
jgi:hypothetical protein